MLQNVEQAFNIHSNGENLDVLIILVKKNWLQTDVERFGGNDALDYLAKNILKGNEFLKRWRHINSQTTYVKQHKHVDFIPRNVIDHHQLIVKGGGGLFFNGKVMPRNDDGNWKMTFNYEGTNSLGFSTEVKIGESVLKNGSGILEEVHYGFFIVEMGLQMIIGHRHNIHQL